MKQKYNLLSIFVIVGKRTHNGITLWYIITSKWLKKKSFYFQALSDSGQKDGQYC